MGDGWVGGCADTHRETERNGDRDGEREINREREVGLRLEGRQRGSQTAREKHEPVGLSRFIISTTQLSTSRPC